MSGIMERFELLSNGMKLLQQDGAFRISTDSILLADFCAPLRGKSVVDLGCGGGTLGILLCAADPDCRVIGVEIQEKACDIARRNIEINALEDRFRVVRADLRALEGMLDAGSFDAVASNPPYFPAGSGPEPPDETEAIARAAEWIRGGEVVGFPTETVYGLGADAMNAEANK